MFYITVAKSSKYWNSAKRWREWRSPN